MYATRWFRCVIILLTVIASLSLIEPGIAQSSLKVTALRTEYKTNPLGIDTRKPRLSWQLQSSDARHYAGRISDSSRAQ